jgi:hypothetical protein
MSASTKTLVVDYNGKPSPQYYNQTNDIYEVVQGDTGAIYVKIKNTTLDINMASSLPAGTNNIGDVDVLTLPSIPTGNNIIGQCKLTDGTDVLLVNTNGSINIVPVNGSGTELFTLSNPAQVQIAKTFKGLPSATPIYTISTSSGTLLYVTELSSAGITTGQKTISTTAIEIYAGASNRLANRYVMKITSAISNTGYVYIGASGVTSATGDILYPGDTVVIEFTL